VQWHRSKRCLVFELAYLQTGGAVDPPDALVIVRYAITPQQHDHSWQAIPAMFRCQCNETQPQRLIVPPRLVVEEFAIDADPTANRSFFRFQPFSYGLHRVAPEMPCLRQIVAALTPALSSLRMPTICDSVNRDLRMWNSFRG
jgi:hypothetical protein